MRNDQSVPRSSPPTLRSRRLGRLLRAMREENSMRLAQVSGPMKKTDGWVSKVESGEIKVSPATVMELLYRVYGMSMENEQAQALVAMAESLREPGWWQRMNTLSGKYMQYASFEEGATRIQGFDPLLVHGLLQIESYAEAVARVSHPTSPQAVRQSVDSKLNRQAVLGRQPEPPLVHVVLSEAALHCEVGGREVLAAQLRHLVEMAARPNILIQVLRFAAGAHLADRGMFTILGFEGDDPDLGYIDTTGGGSLFLEGADDMKRIFDDLKTRSMSPAESVHYIDEWARQWAKD